ncbi:trypsin-like serine protease [Robertmurraya sp. DFI.2.37]|uniref:trypsin-like serine peptidase n=1 Tax=Robertmurraya sp. DFI.2.37 TaxID=3031819 RepID=UPI001786B6ED|nr:trypsin-like serine protease [Robertmurraya sp. DFI.2.37]MDF1508028.1 trypsin-like serine protease [Robertmurraya sp. DFI.2.37]
MKKSVFLTIFLFTFLFVPISALADETLGDFHFNAKESSHPLDRVNSKGEVTKYEDYSNKNLTFINETKSFQGSGELNPIFVGDLLNKGFLETTQPLVKDVTTNEVAPFVVIGPDGRTRVENTTVFPYSAITYISLEWADGSRGSCTGTLIGIDRVLTNGHCVVNPTTQRGIMSATVYPGVSGSTALFGAYNAIDYYVTSHWINTGAISQDYAVLVLSPSNGRHAGERAGYAGIRQVTNILNQNIGIYGYPGDLIRRDGAINQYGMRGNVASEDSQVAYYTIDTAPGQSGSAMLNTSNQVIGVHSSGYSDRNGNPVRNGGPKMSSSMFEFVSNALN